MEQVTTWNPHRYIEHFGSKEKLQEATSLYPKAFHKAVNSKTINIAIKEYLDKATNFTHRDRFARLDNHLEKGETKAELMKRYKCSLATINEEIKKNHDTTTVWTARAKIKRERREAVDLSKVEYGLIVAIKRFSTVKSIAMYLCLSPRGARHRLEKVFSISDLTSIRSMIEEYEKAL